MTTPRYAAIDMTYVALEGSSLPSQLTVVYEFAPGTEPRQVAGGFAHRYVLDHDTAAHIADALNAAYEAGKAAR